MSQLDSGGAALAPAPPTDASWLASAELLAALQGSSWQAVAAMSVAARTTSAAWDDAGTATARARQRLADQGGRHTRPALARGLTRLVAWADLQRDDWSHVHRTLEEVAHGIHVAEAVAETVRSTPGPAAEALAAQTLERLRALYLVAEQQVNRLFLGPERSDRPTDPGEVSPRPALWRSAPGGVAPGRSAEPPTSAGVNDPRSSSPGGEVASFVLLDPDRPSSLAIGTGSSLVGLTAGALSRSWTDGPPRDDATPADNSPAGNPQYERHGPHAGPASDGRAAEEWGVPTSAGGRESTTPIGGLLSALFGGRVTGRGTVDQWDPASPVGWPHVGPGAAWGAGLLGVGGLVAAGASAPVGATVAGQGATLAAPGLPPGPGAANRAGIPFLPSMMGSAGGRAATTPRVTGSPRGLPHEWWAGAVADPGAWR